ncbi:hypothetical protein AC629_10195 [Bradyrhizobium sp. NAS80.1]|nr:hypothetical protein AC630_39200 [Bradyrhizobium sp. AS23.2]OKO88294.1 hypothetical protein AC629_10195 [Bradyrhizobium sp. NAS80.1]
MSLSQALEQATPCVVGVLAGGVRALDYTALAIARLLLSAPLKPPDGVRFDTIYRRNMLDRHRLSL